MLIDIEVQHHAAEVLFRTERRCNDCAASQRRHWPAQLRGGVMRRLFALFFAIVALTPCDPAVAKRVALVVGIDAYDNLGPGAQLKKAVKDARTIASTLKELEFAVTLIENPRRAEFVKGWQKFLDGIAKGDEVGVFFAGHGIEINRDNYLLPRDAPSSDEGEHVVTEGSIRLVKLLDSPELLKARLVLVILDACRNNPFSPTGRSIGAPRGLARTEPPRGTMIVYSAGVGQRALDEVPGRPEIENSIFTHVFAPLLRTQGHDLIKLIKQVQIQVNGLAEKAGHNQLPAYYDQTLVEVALSGRGAASAPPPAPAAAMSPPATIDECDRLAADPYDSESVAAGFAGARSDNWRPVHDPIYAARAVPACEAALKQHPSVQRFAYQLARALDAKGDFEKAKSGYEALAAKGHGPAMHALAVMHYNGRGVPKDGAGEGKYWLDRAVAAGNADAMFLRGFFASIDAPHTGYWPPDHGLAVRYWRRAVELGHILSMNALAGMYDRGLGGLDKDAVTASFWMTKALKGGDPNAFWVMTTSNLSADFYKAMKQRLTELDCYKGPIDGGNSPQLQTAVLALKHSCR
jgi:hypothetical protein